MFCFLTGSFLLLELSDFNRSRKIFQIISHITVIIRSDLLGLGSLNSMFCLVIAAMPTPANKPANKPANNQITIPAHANEAGD